MLLLLFERSRVFSEATMVTGSVHIKSTNRSFLLAPSYIQRMHGEPSHAEIMGCMHCLGVTAVTDKKDVYNTDGLRNHCPPLRNVSTTGNSVDAIFLPVPVLRRPENKDEAAACFSTDMPRLICFTKSDGEAASTDLRVIKPLHIAEQMGWQTRVLPLPLLSRWDISYGRWRDLWAANAALRNAGTDCVVILQRIRRRPEFFYLLQKYRKSIPYLIVDIDDATWVHNARETNLALSLCDEAWCGSQVVLQYAAQRTRSARFVPTTVDVAEFLIPKDPEPPVIGWMGDTEAHSGNLLLLADILRQGIDSLPPFCLRLIGIRDEDRAHIEVAFQFLGARVQLMPWVVPTALDPGHLPRLLSECSIGIMPLTETAFHQGKSASKLVFYLAASLPVVASDVGENTFVVQEPKHGFLARDASQWIETLAFLLSHPNERRIMGAKGHDFVAGQYDRAAVYRPLFSELAKRVSQPGKP